MSDTKQQFTFEAETPRRWLQVSPLPGTRLAVSLLNTDWRVALEKLEKAKRSSRGF